MNRTVKSEDRRKALPSHRLAHDPGRSGVEREMAGEHSGASTARIAEIRRQIAEGTYLTEEKLDVAVEQLCAALRTPAPRRAAAG